MAKITDIVSSAIPKINSNTNSSRALAPYSGYTQVSKKLDNFVFQTSSSFLNKVADKNRYVKFGDRVVDTYGAEFGNDFSETLTSPWVKGSSFTLVNGYLVNSGTGFGSYTTVTLSGGSYTITTSSNTLKIEYYNGSSWITVIDGSDVSNYGVAYTTQLRFSGGVSTSIDKISIRAIQTADFTNTVPDVAEVITDGSNTTSVAVNVGDYVVDGSELVVNGTFDSDTSGWTLASGYATYDSSNNSILVNNQTGTTNQAFQQSNVYVLGEKNIITYTVSNYVSGSIRVNFFNGSVYVYGRTVTANGTYTDVLDVTLSSQRIIRFETINNTILSIDNISVKRVSDTFRAKQTSPIGTALTNSTYFEDRTQIGVTNQALAYHAYNTLTNAYEGIKTEVLFSDVSKEQLLDNSVWMSNNGFSKVSQFLYSKGSYLCLPIGVVQC